MENNSEKLRESHEKMKKISNLLVLFNITKNKKLALLALEELEIVIKKIITILLKYENSLKRLKISDNPEINFRNFVNISQKNYGMFKDELGQIKEILEISKAHKISTMEFTRKEEIIIMDKNQRIKKLSQKKLATTLTITEKLFRTLNSKLKG